MAMTSGTIAPSLFRWSALRREAAGGPGGALRRAGARVPPGRAPANQATVPRRLPGPTPRADSPGRLPGP
ncbi:hypothetical protein GCM10009546_16500 [Actinomadura livida]|uniref:Uncharacterized protein n=1 Tax=Actinomadura livida TaxID=79909 RepID=A0ABP3NZ97_9ACTN|nr:hypothetical protein GCM10010208_44280 [Actinomadura livida]